MTPSLRSLSKQEHFLNDSLDMLLQLVENYNEQRDKDALEGWRQHAATLYKEFKSIRLQTEVQMDQEKPETDPDNEANLRKIRFDFETKYLKVYSLIVVQLENLKKAEQATLNSVPPKSEETPDLTHSRIKLPEHLTNHKLKIRSHRMSFLPHKPTCRSINQNPLCQVPPTYQPLCTETHEPFLLPCCCRQLS
ncbi:hypothetical protein quinque_007648 [Culex quinquefasciatus]